MHLFVADNIHVIETEISEGRRGGREKGDIQQRYCSLGSYDK